MKPERLQELVDQFATQRIVVIGDFFLDRYLDTDPRLAETSIETGKTAHQVVSIRPSPGAAGTVINNLADLGAGALHAIGPTGDDGEAYDLRNELERRDCRTDGLLPFDSLMTPTYLKPRNIAEPGLAGEHERYDTKNREPVASAVGESIVAALDRVLPEVDAVIIADQVEEDECGAITSSVRDALSQRVQQHRSVVFFADSRRRIRSFRNVIIKPNQFEAVGLDNPAPTDQVDLEQLKKAVQQLRQDVGAPVCATRAEHGILVTDPEPTLIPGLTISGPIDPTGAGDSVSAGLVLALASGATLPEAALVGILVASITVQQLATTGTARPEQLPERLALWHEQNEAPSA